MSGSYLVDTDWAINHLNGQERTRQRLEELVASGLWFSTISLAEVYEGIYYSNNPAGNEKSLVEFLQDVTVISVDEETSRLFGKERGHLRSVGQMISDFDLMIGVTALQHNFTLLTNNRRHFENIEGLRIESLT
ncbi:MAG: type II toxin-antitoxin system VapC family toxin [Acidobacteria bacterium]|nr:MAG: type II toxin-antitoxin system VapC family toxin [Acidobacteriota bacterium]